jgi:hypothetical protein
VVGDFFHREVIPLVADPADYRKGQPRDRRADLIAVPTPKVEHPATTAHDADQVKAMFTLLQCDPIQDPADPFYHLRALHRDVKVDNLETVPTAAEHRQEIRHASCVPGRDQADSHGDVRHRQELVATDQSFLSEAGKDFLALEFELAEQELGGHIGNDECDQAVALEQLQPALEHHFLAFRHTHRHVPEPAVDQGPTATPDPALQLPDGMLITGKLLGELEVAVPFAVRSQLANLSPHP